MKTKLRKIIVNDKLFYWAVWGNNVDGDGGSHFRIWHNKKIIYDDVANTDIKPSDVKNIIRIHSKTV